LNPDLFTARPQLTFECGLLTDSPLTAVCNFARWRPNSNACYFMVDLLGYYGYLL